MAAVNAISSVIQSLADYLNHAYGQSALNTPFKFTFVPVSSTQLAPEEEPDVANTNIHRVTVFLYRVSVNQHLRNQGRPRDPGKEPAPLSLDLHLLFSVWTASATAEHSVIAWLMRELHVHPVLDASLLKQDAQWERDEIVQLIPAELTTEDMMRLWDALTPSYRLSVSYIARVVRIDPDESDSSYPPVVARRLAFTSGVPRP